MRATNGRRGARPWVRLGSKACNENGGRRRLRVTRPERRQPFTPKRARSGTRPQRPSRSGSDRSKECSVQRSTAGTIRARAPAIEKGQATLARHLPRPDYLAAAAMLPAPARKSPSSRRRNRCCRRRTPHPDRGCRRRRSKAHHRPPLPSRHPKPRTAPRQPCCR